MLVTEACSPEVGGFIHVEPDTCKVDLLVQPLKLFLPEYGSIRMSEIGVIDLTRPYFSFVVVLVGLRTFQPNIILPPHSGA